MHSTLPPDSAETDAAIVDRRLARWCDAAAGGDWQRFERRLRWDGFDLQTVRPLLRPAVPAAGAALPAWAGLLDAAVRAAAADPGAAFAADHGHVPFVEVLAPFVVYATGESELPAAVSAGHLAPAAVAGLQAYLLDYLSALSCQALFTEFSVFRAAHRSGADARFSAALSGQDRAPPASRKLYAAFCERMHRRGCVPFFAEFSFLGRQIANALGLWLESTNEFVRHLIADREAIGERFDGGRNPGRLVEARAGASDRHHGGRSVVLLRFESGLSLVYKPRSLAQEQGLFRLMAWYNARRPAAWPDLKPLATLLRAGHGWAEFADSRPCTSRRELEDYYERAGMLLCLIEALNGSDYHSENVVACGAYPVPVDMEVLCAPQIERVLADPEGRERVRSAGHSVLDTCFLPEWRTGPDGQAYDISGLGSSEGQATPYRRLVWDAVNADAMEARLVPVVFEDTHNRPTLAGENSAPERFVAELQRGFGRFHAFLREHRGELLGRMDLLPPFRKTTVRHLVRQSQTYGVLLNRLKLPRNVREGVDASLAIEGLSQVFTRERRRPRSWPILAAEQRALCGGDIPLFCSRAEALTLAAPEGPIVPRYFFLAGYALARQRVENLSAADLRWQSALIRDAFLARGYPLEPRQPRVADPSLSAPTSGPDGLADVLCSQAIALGDRIVDAATTRPDGHLAWYAITQNPESPIHAVARLHPNLYAGQAGLAFFLSALEACAPNRGFGEVARGAVAELRRWLHFRPAAIASAMNIGAMEGLGSLSYALLRAGSFLQDESLIADAEILARQITRPRIDADDDLDVISGSAGALIVLLLLHAQTKAPQYLERALRCGRHLLARRVASPAGPRAWPDRKGRLLTGFSHGAAGIACALMRLWSCSGEPRFRDAAREGLSYERAVFDPVARNWPDFTVEPPGFANRWCHGATGIGLARLALPECPARERAEIATAVERTLDDALVDVDHLCCGNAGQLSFLFDAARRLGNAAWESAANARLARLLARARLTGSYVHFAGLDPQAFSPTLMRGAAGIGYEWLRIAKPARELPSLLMLE
ncbi:MAG: type 2 lantipeptide synthetase LanM [Gammaproteobacteria bacterium]|nr:type 2 lantipeptide synthetase LanM [Gammaproteobacteria bacterium]MBI5616479.1 type 2 lantipeptide synthetase LanM [Gammaproteobacteria bacterium]